ncbi:hypothetical protein PV08_03570 [Exophiala spinifera]|uniref:SAM-dependent MTase RsmB/NOP-type domain-containing protein n=1 Tax=Exophiala spinifera TaxID=91928 RepID=A0A0D1YVF1_9EURO|nr:uncharacterized protein PV08_03570 [Exophiala spinifera]KIW19276.1 hypothetical protein PV08_03570 [Exophiala spinifera]
MSLYYDAATVLTSDSQDGSFKSRIYGNKLNLKSKPAHIYALISETAKFNQFVKEVVDNADILSAEPKLTPILSLLLVHDHFFSKRGIAAPANHPLRQSIDRHKARLQAEFTKARLRRKCANTDALKIFLLRENPRRGTRSQPRWIRVNTLKSTVAEQLATTFKGYRTDVSLSEISQSAAAAKVLAIDRNIPNILALPPESDFTKTQAYKDGTLILQDKASCFPAYLLAGSQAEAVAIGDCIDGCAAPGNKTSHLAALLAEDATSKANNTVSKVYACERDRQRSQVLDMMMAKSGAASSVTVLAGQDFLKLDPRDPRFQNVTHLLLDPSCSGSGIIGREDTPTLVLPEDPRASKPSKASNGSGTPSKNSKKRKRPHVELESELETPSIVAGSTAEETKDASVDEVRLARLSALQSRIVEHALSFPAAVRVTYSTCSIHVAENEAVVSKVLDSDVAKDRGWSVLRRHEQVAGLREWKHRGCLVTATATATATDAESDDGKSPSPSPSPLLTPDALEACIRCHRDDDEGTMGFFVCGFVRSTSRDRNYKGQQSADRAAAGAREPSTRGEESWEGFSD